MISENLSKTPSTAKIAVLGGGYIGSLVVNDLTTRGYNVSLLTREKCDYSNQISLTHYLSINDITHVINCSGFTGRPNVDECEVKKELCWDLNVVVPLTVARVCNRLGICIIHISSGCIYQGYSKIFTEDDVPNFGMFDHSSFYSKTKHAFETLVEHIPIKILRIRMPICTTLDNSRNYISKILKYPKLIDAVNSKTYIPDLLGFIDAILRSKYVNWGKHRDIYNVVNGGALSTKEVVRILNSKGIELTPEWVEIKDLPISAPRSNCVLDNTKASEIFKLKEEKDIYSWLA